MILQPNVVRRPAIISRVLDRGTVFWGGLVAVLVGVAAVIALPFVEAVPTPFGFSFLLAATLALALAVIARRYQFISSALTVVFAFALGLAIAEFFFAWQSATAKPGVALTEGGSFTNGYFNPVDPDLGYSPNPNKTVDHIRMAGKTTVFRAIYHIGPGAFRVTPGAPKAAETDVFFGDSFTFGEGLNDDQTLPAQYAKARGYETNVVNLGFHGYGPHQMLRALETGRFDRYFTGEVKHVFYQAIRDHIDRASGRAPWDLNGPRYILDPATGAPIFVGKYSDFPSQIFERRHPVLDRSLVVRALRAALFSRVRQGDIDLLVAILAKSAELVHDRFHADFTLLVWDFDPRSPTDTAGARIADAAEKKGLHVVRASQIFANRTADFAKDYLIAIDGHPNARADAVLGAALAKLEH